jgi:prepilin-type N-terminal cleavage/methylation domain-containing protein
MQAHLIAHPADRRRRGARQGDARGFTLIELLVVIAIIAILAALLVHECEEAGVLAL